MAINRAKYPITFEEARKVCLDLADNLIAEARENGRMGDVRPEVLQWAAGKLQRMDFVGWPENTPPKKRRPRH